MRLLVVEDSESLSHLVTAGLTKAGYDVDAYATTSDARTALERVRYAAMVLDLGLPDGDGRQVLREMRERGDATPVVILTARSSIAERVEGLRDGADDYLGKPFAFEELLAHLQAVLRRPAQYLGGTLQIGNLTFDTGSRQVCVNGVTKILSQRECAVLELLMQRHGRVVPKRYLEEQLFGRPGEQGGPNAIEVYVYRLRQQLDEWGAQVVIHTVRGVGYLIPKGTDEQGMTP